VVAHLGDERFEGGLWWARDDADPEVREKVAYACHRLDFAWAFDQLVVFLHDPAHNVRAQAAISLASLADPELRARAIEPLIGRLITRNPDTRRVVVKALARIVGKDTAQPLGAKYGTWRSWWEEEGKELYYGE
jgi:HEAT repeat protein